MTDMTVKEHGESRRLQTKGLGHIEGVSEAFRKGNGAYQHLKTKGLQSLVQNRFAFASKMPIRNISFSKIFVHGRNVAYVEIIPDGDDTQRSFSVERTPGYLMVLDVRVLRTERCVLVLSHKP